ncbi:putative mitochondrial protein [Tanacetum coccineum]
MRVRGHVLKQILHILMDSGSTHNFLDLYMAKRLGCKIRNTCPLEVSVAGGSKLISQYMVKDFQWKLQGVVFETDVMLLPLGGCEIVLGVQWLSTLGTIQWNFKDLVMKFLYEGQKVVLRGTHKSELAWLSGRHMSNGQEMVLGAELTHMLEEYADVVEVPKELHPQRQFDHKIPLKEDNVTIKIRPYRPSNSPFSSPIVMVKKKDRSWRMCIDYRQLNKHTVKDKFPILVIEELIDELQGAQSKCVFGTTQVEYLGHVISAQRVSTDPSYYRRFIKGYATISQPLTMLLKKNAFQWNSQAQEAFKRLQQAMVQSLVLALPNFEEEFIIKTNASGIGLGAVLQQNKHPIAYLSKTLAPKHQSLSTYEKELLARLTTPFQSKWLPKLLGYDYEIEYKKGVDNAAADVLYRIERQGVLFSLLAGTSNEIMDVVVATWSSDSSLQAIIKGLQDKTLIDSKYSWQNDQLRRKDKWVVGKDLELRKKLLNHFHNSVVGGHSGVQATTKSLTTYFYWKGLRKMVKEWVRTCDVCQRNTSDLSAYPGLLQPLPIPDKIWQDLSMDFIESLLISVEAVDRTLQAREQVIELLKFNLKKAQDRMKSQADKRMSDRNFELNDWVYLKLQPYRQLTVRQGRHHKLSSKFFGPFQVLAKIGKVAYKLKLPETARVHLVFHVSQLKPCYSDSASKCSFPLCDSKGHLAATPLKLLDRRMVKQNNRIVVFGLIQWSNGSEEDATWERLDDLLTRFPEFILDP